jgi:hypothetical protein
MTTLPISKDSGTTLISPEIPEGRGRLLDRIYVRGVILVHVTSSGPFTLASCYSLAEAERRAHARVNPTLLLPETRLQRLDRDPSPLSWPEPAKPGQRAGRKAAKGWRTSSGGRSARAVGTKALIPDGVRPLIVCSDTPSLEADRRRRTNKGHRVGPGSKRSQGGLAVKPILVCFSRPIRD